MVFGIHRPRRAQNLKSRPWFQGQTRLNYAVKGTVDLNQPLLP